MRKIEINCYDHLGLAESFKKMNRLGDGINLAKLTWL